MPTLEEIADPMREVLSEDPDVAFAYLFGSVAKGRTRPSSDIDVAVCFGSGRESHERLELAERAIDLEGRLEGRLGRPVQVVVLEYAPPELVQNALGHGTLVFTRDEAARVRFYVDAGQSALDYA